MLARSLTCWSFLVAAVATVSAFPGNPEQARQLFEKGQALLAECDLAGALQAYESAAQADPEDLNYQVGAAILGRVIKIREMLPQLADTPKWAPALKAVYSYCLDNRAYAEALNQANTFHAKQADSESAAMVANVRLETGDNALAVEVIEALPIDKRANDSWVLLGIAQARLDRAAEAKAALQAIQPTEKPDASLLFDQARINSLLGDQAAAGECLTLAFENTPPSRLDAAKAKAQANADLVKLRDQAAFAKVMETESKIPESKCSGGASCGSCPSKGTCGSAGKQDGEHKECEKKP